MNGIEAFSHLCRYIQSDMLPQAQLHYLITLVRDELAAPKAINQLSLIEQNNKLNERIITLEILLEDQQEQINRLLPKDSSTRKGKKKNE